MEAITRKLRLPSRSAKPRRAGLTVAIDGGLPLNQFCDVVESHDDIIDFIKFGWGTALVTSRLADKIEAVRRHGVRCLFGGTLFEKFYARGAFPEYLEYCHQHQLSTVEVSSGSMCLSPDEITAVIERCRDQGFCVFCEIGCKDPVRSEAMTPAEWSSQIREAISAGADFIVLEAREAGTGGICAPNGQVRGNIFSAILDSGVPPEQLIFEAPQRHQQAYFIRELGSNVNLGNISPNDLISLETIRQGLRFETFDLDE